MPDKKIYLREQTPGDLGENLVKLSMDLSLLIQGANSYKEMWEASNECMAALNIIRHEIKETSQYSDEANCF